MHSFAINDKKSTIEFVSKSKNSNTEVTRIKITKNVVTFVHSSLKVAPC